MKNAMKKLMSLVLVAMILVSALPFAASAESADAVTVVIVDNATSGDVACFNKVPSRGGKSAVGDLLNYWAKNTAEVESAAFINAYAYYADGSRADVVEADTLSGGDKVRIRADIVWAQAEEETPDEPEQNPEQNPEQTPPAEPVVEPIKIVVKVGSSDNVVWTGEKVPANGEYALVENLLSYCWNKDWNEAYDYDYAWSSAQQAKVGMDSYIYAGDTLSVMLTKKGSNEDSDNFDDVVTGSDKYNKNSGDVVLEICMDKNQTPVKTPSIKSTIALDGKVTLDEVKSVVKQYFNSIDTDTGIVYDGLYVKQTYAGNVIEWVNDDKVSTVEGLYDAANNSKLVTIRVYISNAKLASSGNADPTNPKTGDSIMMPVAVMTVSACALAVAFYLNKKRAF